MASTDYRLVITENGIREDFTSGTYHDAYDGWRILADYGRPGVTPTIERYVGGTWVEVDPATGEVQATPERTSR